MTNIQAALGVSQISRMSELERKSGFVSVLLEESQKLGDTAAGNDNGSVSSHWMCASYFQMKTK